MRVEPHEYLSTLRRRWWMIAASGIAGAGLAFAYASTIPVLFRSSTTVFVAAQEAQTPGELVQGSTYIQSQVQSYAQLASLPEVLDPVIDELGLETTPQALASTVSADIRLNTVIIDISVLNASAEQAAIIANSVTESLKRVVEDLAPRGPDDAPAITMSTVSSARVSTVAASPNIRFIVFSGLAAGLVLAVLYALAREVLDTRVRGERDLERVSDAPLLGTIARRKTKKVSAIVMRSDPYSRAAEDFRRMATNLEFADVDNPVRSVVVTSSLPADGKTTTAINLALAMADRLERVLLMDADLRKPSIAEYCQVDGAVGLTSVLVGSASLDDAIRPWAGGILDLLPSGVVPANPSQMLGSDAMVALMDELISRYDFIVLDSAPLLPVTDSLTLAKLTDGAIVVARYKTTTRQHLVQALLSLDVVTARVLGLVLNGVKQEGGDAYYGYQAAAPGNPALGDRVLPTELIEPPEAAAGEPEAAGVAQEETPVPAASGPIVVGESESEPEPESEPPESESGIAHAPSETTREPAEGDSGAGERAVGESTPPNERELTPRFTPHWRTSTAALLRQRPEVTGSDAAPTPRSTA